MATQAALHKFYRARVTGNKNEVLRAACELEVASKSLRKVVKQKQFHDRSTLK